MTSPMFELPEHLAMGVNDKGQGPETDPRLIAAIVCWCGKDGCTEYHNKGMF